MSGILLVAGASSQAVLDLSRPPVSWSTTVGTTTNASAFNTITTDRNYERAYVIPCGRYELTESLVLPSRWGYLLTGSGGNSRDLQDGHYATTGLGGPVSRLVWRGNNSSGMLRMDSGGSQINGIHFQGRPVPGILPDPPTDDDPAAMCGLHIRSSSSGDITNTSKCNLEHLSFYQCANGILVGRDLAGDMTGADHSDSISAGDMHFMHPAGIYANTGSCIHIRCAQAVSNHFRGVFIHGNPANGVYLERGGKTMIDMLSFTGTSTGTGTALRVGLMDVNEGVLTVGHVSIDASNTNSQLLVMDDVYSISNQIININSGVIAGGAAVLMDLRPGTINIKNMYGLKTGSIKMRGGSYDGNANRYPCCVHLENCNLASDWPADLVASGSTGPYRLTWRNCYKIHEVTGVGIVDGWGIPFEDGEVSSNNPANSTDLVKISAP